MAQQNIPVPGDSLSSISILSLNPRIYHSNDTIWVNSGICKTLQSRMFTSQTAAPFFRQLEGKVPLLKVHGNIQYDFTYRSFVDTPFSQNDFLQHVVQTTLDFTIKESYPVKVTILTRQSNSPYFDDITDVNVQFSQRQFFTDLKSGLNRKIPGVINVNELTDLEKVYQLKKWEASALTDWINHPGRLEEIIASKEMMARGRLEETGRTLSDRIGDSLPTVPASLEMPTTNFLKKKIFEAAEAKFQKARDSLEASDSMIAGKTLENPLLPDNITLQLGKKKEELDKLLKELKHYEGRIASLKKSFGDSVALLKQKLLQIKDPAQLKAFIREHKLDAKDLPKGWETLAAINNIGIGRTWVDHSDLTVKNISLTGINAEINPGRFYLAFAAGRINYRFRDFVVKNNDQPKQSLYLLRAGIGRKEGNHFIASWYDGKRNLLSSFNSSIIQPVTLERVIGMSLQVRLQIDPNNYIVAESAKSSFHNTGQTTQTTEGLMGKVWNFKDRSNEAYSLKLVSHFPMSQTRINGYYRKLGEHFQSFNLQPVNVGQDAWQFKVQQSLWKKRLMIDVGIRKNDFNSPFINPGLTSKTVFKSAQVTLRVPKYPFISIGYYPSSQLTLLDNNVLVENQYNTFSSVVTHAYRLKKLSMNTSLVFLKFYNNGADTGFIYYNASSWTATHFIFLKNLQLQSGLTITDQQDLHVKTWEQSFNYQARNWLTLGGGLKYNRINNTGTLWGGNAVLGLVIKKFGTVQASYDKSYLPGTVRNLLPVDMGRVTYYKVF